MVGRVVGDAWCVYRLLFRRSILVSASVYAVIGAFEELASVRHGPTVGGASVLAVIVGQELVQGALVVIVRDVHEGRPPETIGTMLGHSWRRLKSLVGASCVYAASIVVGLVFLVVPGLVAAARYALMPPAIMLEEKGVWDALERSRTIVGAGHTWGSLRVVASAFAITGVPFYALTALDGGGPAAVVAESALAALTAPFSAHILSVLYYRLTDPDRPAIDPAVRTWRSVWEGPAV